MLELRVCFQSPHDLLFCFSPVQFVPKTKVNMCYIVMTVLFNESNQVLMVQEAKKSCSGSWYLPAGRLEPNESLVVSASVCSGSNMQQFVCFD